MAEMRGGKTMIGAEGSAINILVWPSAIEQNSSKAVVHVVKENDLMVGKV